jgi:hypothetical protein
MLHPEVMTDGCSGQARRPEISRGRWTSFLAAALGPRGQSRTLCERDNPRHRVRVEHDNHTLLVHVSDEDGGGWTTIAIDRASRAWSVAQRDTQLAAATSASEALYND